MAGEWQAGRRKGSPFIAYLPLKHKQFSALDTIVCRYMIYLFISIYETYFVHDWVKPWMLQISAQCNGAKFHIRFVHHCYTFHSNITILDAIHVQCSNTIVQGICLILPWRHLKGPNSHVSQATHENQVNSGHELNLSFSSVSYDAKDLELRQLQAENKRLRLQLT